MGNHYSDYLKKNVSVKDLVFDEIREEDKALLKRVKKAHIKANMGFLVIFSIGFTACTYFFTAFLITPSDTLIIKLLSLIILGAGMFGCGMLVYEIIAGIKGIRKGVVLTAQERWKTEMEETLLTSIFSISTWKTKTNLS